MIPMQSNAPSVRLVLTSPWLLAMLLLSKFSDVQSTVTANTKLHLQKAKWKKFTQEGKADEFTQQYLNGDGIIQQLLDDNEVQQHGCWGPIFHNFLLHHNNSKNIKPCHCQAADTMITCATNHPCPDGILHTANIYWQESDPLYHYGFFYTSPTPKEFAIQQLSLVITQSFGTHLKVAGTRIGIKPPQPSSPTTQTAPTSPPDNIVAIHTNFACRHRATLPILPTNISLTHPLACFLPQDSQYIFDSSLSRIIKY